MSKKLRKDVGEDPEYLRCALQKIHPSLIGGCGGRVTREHALIFAGKKIQEKWAIIPCCAKHHGVDQYLDQPGQAPKAMRVWVALNRGTDSDLRRFSKAINYLRERDRLNGIYGMYVPPPIPSPIDKKELPVAGTVLK